MNAAVITGMKGAGAVSRGEPTPAGVNRQVFVLDVGVSMTGAYGSLDYIDYSFVKEDGNHPHFVVGPTWPGTRITSFAQTSDKCVAFEGIGRLLNTDELLVFRVEACDNAQPGVWLDVFGIMVPQRLITHGGIYSVGPDLLTDGELTRSGTTVSLPVPLLP